MHLRTGLRLVRVHYQFHHGSYDSAPLLASSPAKQLAPSRHSRYPVRAASTAAQSQAASMLNPPASTRPPPLELPTRDPSSSIFKHLFRLGKAYTTFYKAGLGAILVNRRLAQSSSSLSSSIPTSTFPTRADILLRARVRHDLSRLPLFGLLVLVCGEFTPLIVLVFPRLTPYTCRIPKQTDALRRSSEARRAASFRALRYKLQHAGASAQKPVRDDMGSGHICRSLGLTSSAWDKLGLDGLSAATLARRAIREIAADDAMIRRSGGIGALVDDEVVLACEDRGIDVRDEPIDRLRASLEDWLRKTAPEGLALLSKKGDVDVATRESAQRDAEDKVKKLLLGLAT
ncbi:hypothetical protein GGR54DRAFT_403743 [Hypoxylon sp. NC1633]|nr:hypothetical protein GGR54DRAFT_403743 [Hypoxylon sp. NC1633]